MTQPKTRASRFGERLFKSTATSALALSALAGGVVFSGVEAKALLCTFDSEGVVAEPDGKILSINNCDYTDDMGNIIGPAPENPLIGGYYGVYYDTNPVPTDKQIKFINGPTGGSGTIDWYWEDVSGNGDWRIPPDPPSIDEWHVDVDFFPDDFNLPVPGKGANPSVFEYIVQITEPDYYFHDITLDAIFGAPNPGPDSTVQKDIYSVINHQPGILIGSITCTGFANGSTFCTPSISLPNSLYKQLYIIDTAFYGGRLIDAYQNSVRQQVHRIPPAPAPLPILGAAAAFGSIRKARKFSSHLKTFSMG